MTLFTAAVDWLNISINLLLVIHVIICLLLALVVLMQRPKQEGLGAAFGSGLTDQAFGARTTDVLQKGTVYLGTLFFVVTIVLAILIGKRQSSTPTVTADEEDKTEEVALPTPVVPPADVPVVMPESNTEGSGEENKEESEPAADTPEPTETPAETPTEAPVPTDPAPAETPAEVPAETPAETTPAGN